MSSEKLYSPTESGRDHRRQIAYFYGTADASAQHRAGRYPYPADGANTTASAPAAGLIITEATQISAQAKGYAGAPGLHSPEQIAAWQKITAGVHAENGRIAVQLWHTGRISHSSLQPGGQPRR